MSTAIILPRIMEIGAGAISKLPNIVQSLGGSKPLIITDKMMVQLGYIQQLQDLLSEEGLAADVFSGTEPEPTAASIEAGLQCVLDNNYDVIIVLTCCIKSSFFQNSTFNFALRRTLSGKHKLKSCFGR